LGFWLAVENLLAEKAVDCEPGFAATIVPADYIPQGSGSETDAPAKLRQPKPLDEKLGSEGASLLPCEHRVNRHKCKIVISCVTRQAPIAIIFRHRKLPLFKAFKPF
jgi:hypothetical protein